MIDYIAKNKILGAAVKNFPKACILSGIHPKTRRFGLFVYEKERGSNLPVVGAEPLLFVEAAGSSEKDIETVMVKLALVLG